MLKLLSEISPAPESCGSHEKLGYAAMLLSAAPNRALYPVSYLSSVLSPAIQAGNMRLYLSTFDGSPVAYAAWAWLSASTERRTIQSGKMQLHASEWNEGDSLWIADLIAPFGHLKYVSKDLADSVFPSAEKFRYLRQRAGKAVALEVLRPQYKHMHVRKI